MNEMKLEEIRFNGEDVIAASGALGFAPTAGASTYYTSTIDEWNQAYGDGKVGYDAWSDDVLLLITFADAETINSMVQFADNQPLSPTLGTTAAAGGPKSSPFLPTAETCPPDFIEQKRQPVRVHTTDKARRNGGLCL